MSRLIDADALEEHKFVGNKFVRNDYKQGWNDAIDTIIDNAPSEKGFTRAELEAWLYEIALNNCGNSLERACVELISRLDGFERFVADKRKEINNEQR